MTYHPKSDFLRVMIERGFLADCTDYQGLDEALDPDSSLRVVAIDASGAPVAGDCPLRMTLTLAAVRRGRTIVLLLFGEEKLEVLEQAACGRDPARPVSTLLASVGEALTIVWAP